MRKLASHLKHNFIVFVSRILGVSCNIIKPKDVAGLHPLVNIHDLVGALHLPGDSVVSPPDINHALAVAAAGYGKSKAIYVTVQLQSYKKLLD